MHSAGSSGRSLELTEDVGVAVMRLIRWERRHCLHEDNVG